MKPKYVADSNGTPDVTIELGLENNIQDTYCFFCRQGAYTQADPVWKIVRYRTIHLSRSSEAGIPDGSIMTMREYADGSVLYNKKMSEYQNYEYKLHV